ncbi:HAMP domain-containing histidine kinase [Micrococcales bacterium 31B]|nr:HAMP domain-containing histidine kinase [Micrococcales bacterium 31B]
MAEVAHESNTDIAQEISEFRQFVSEDVNPETAQPFTSVEPMIDVFLRRQRAGLGEIMLGVVGDGSEIRTVTGPRVPTAYDVVSDDQALAEFSSKTSGVFETPEGEFRWARVNVSTSPSDTGSLIIGEFTKPASEQVRDQTKLMIWVALGALVVPGIVGWVVAGQILLPIRTMRRTAAEISQDDLSRRIPVHGRDDLADLAVTFNAMLDRLENAFTTEQRFIDDASHELRTPITIIRGHLELLSDDPAERTATMTLVNQELDRMSRIVSDLLALSKSERPDFIQIGEPVDVAELTLDIDAKVQALGDRKWVLTHVAEGEARLDAQRVTQAMLQLAHNAVQHTQAGDEIRVASRFITEANGHQSVQLTVTDTGPGVSADEVHHIFGRFARGTSERTSGQRSGAGLGLAIVRAIADGHQGSAYVDSVPGQGATFGLVLPVGAPRVAQIEDDDEDEIDLDNDPTPQRRTTLRDLFTPDRTTTESS